MFIKTYDLGLAPAEFEVFTSQLNILCDKLYGEAESIFGEQLDLYMDYICFSDIEPIRHREEYMLEIMMLGVFWEAYIANAMAVNVKAAKTARYLYNLRRKYTTVKPVADKIRGYLASKFLVKTSSRKNVYDMKNFDKLLLWLESTGEFREEAQRLRMWQGYLAKLDQHNSTYFLFSAAAFAAIIQSSAKKYLGKYTRGREQFINEKLSEYKNREDLIFCARRESEYHLNMIGANILNHAYKEVFQRMRDKIVLLPTCMRANDDCKAKADGEHLVCVGCNKECNVCKTVMSIGDKAQVFLIPHSSDFSKFLRRWENADSTGIVGVACVLNLLAGGYEMKNLNINAQCVYLNYAGCKKHWDSEGSPTELNTEKLNEILNSNAERKYIQRHK